MPNERDLLAAIYASPEDDAPRLVYGDWLQTQAGSESSRGELIQVQCRLADPATSDKDHRKLRTAENKLLKELKPKLLEPVMKLAGTSLTDPFQMTKIELERGFISFARVPASVLPKVDELFAIAPLLRRLSVTTSPPYDQKEILTPQHFASKKLSQLTSFHLQSGGIDDKTMPFLADCAALSNVKDLVLGGFDPSGTFTAKGMRMFAESPHFQDVESLSVGESVLGIDKVEILLRASHGWKKLKSLNLSSTQCNGALFTLLASLDAPNPPILEKLAVQYTGIPLTTEQIAALGRAPILANLKSLDIEKCQIGPKGMEAFLKAMTMTKLEQFNVASNSLGDAGGTVLAFSPKMKTLKELDITKNRLGKKAVMALAKSEHLSGLTKILINDRESDEARNALLESTTLANTQIYYRGKKLAMSEDD